LLSVEASTLLFIIFNDDDISVTFGKEIRMPIVSVKFPRKVLFISQPEAITKHYSRSQRIQRKGKYVYKVEVRDPIHNMIQSIT